MDTLIHLRKMNHDLWAKKDLNEAYSIALEIDKTNMPIVTTQVTRDYFRLDGNNVPLSINQIEKIIGTDASQFINEPSATTTSTEADEDLSTF